MALSTRRMAQSSASLRHTRRRRRRRHRSPHGHPPRPLRLRSRPHLGRPSIVASWRRAGARRARASVARWPPPSTAARARRASAKAGRAVVGYGFTRAVLGLWGAGGVGSRQGAGRRARGAGAWGAQRCAAVRPAPCTPNAGRPRPAAGLVTLTLTLTGLVTLTLTLAGLVAAVPAQALAHAEQRAVSLPHAQLLPQPSGEPGAR